MLPESCSNLPQSVERELERLEARIRRLSWLDGPCDHQLCTVYLEEYFRRLNGIAGGTRSSEHLFNEWEDPNTRQLGSYRVKWIHGDWEEAAEWRRHCYLRGNISALHAVIEFMGGLARRSGRDAARHDCWEMFGALAARDSPPQVRDGAWFTAGAAAAWTTISDLDPHPNPFMPLLDIWQQGAWPIGHVHSAETDFVIFTPDIAAVRVFISYKRQDHARNSWVERLYRDLRLAGIDAKLDIYDVPPGASFTNYMTSNISRSRHVLFVVTPAAVEAANAGSGGLGFESQLANSIRISEQRGAFVIPLLREGDVPPHFLRDYRWIDFRIDADYSNRLQELVQWLTGKVSPPPLGGFRSFVEARRSEHVTLGGRDADGTTALMHSVYETDDKAFLTLLAAGSDVNAEDDGGQTALSLASERGYLPMVETLIARGADIDKADLDGRTALMKATAAEHTEVGRFLLLHGANVDLADNRGVSALGVAIAKGNRQLSRALLERSTAFSATPEAPSHLVNACQSGDFKLATTLLRSGVDVNSRNTQGETALILTGHTWSSHYESVVYLLDNGADVNARSTSGETPLASHARHNNPRIVEKLLVRGAAVDARDGQGDTALIIAVNSFNSDVAYALLRGGADVNARSHLGWTALMWAATAGHPDELVTALLAAGADVNVRETRFLRTVLMLAAGGGRAGIISALVAAGGEVNARDVNGKTPLMYAVSEWRDLARTVEELIRVGADLNVVDNDGNTALMKAVSVSYGKDYDHTPSVRTLLLSGAEVNTRNAKGKTALGLTYPECDSIRSLLVNAGGIE